MFTGIIQDMGWVRSIEPGDRLITICLDSEVLSEMVLGGSVSVNGVCLTAVEVGDSRVTAEIGAESLERTTLGDLSVGQLVNLELPMTAESMFDGHIVQGHVDGVGSVASIDPEGESVRISVEAPDEILRYLVEKGSITVDGVSLTVASVDQSGFDVAIIPHTLRATTLGSIKKDERVNLEVDVLAKYVERLLK